MTAHPEQEKKPTRNGATVKILAGLATVICVTVVEVAAFLPAQYYAEVRPGQTAMQIQISGVDPGTQTVTYKSPTINAKRRTFEVKCVFGESS